MNQPRRWRLNLGWLEHPKMQGIAHLATALGALFAVFALGFGAYQLKLSAEQNHAQSLLQREITANASWERYMELASDHPQLAGGLDYARLSRVQQIEYYWFVERMLFAGEQVLGVDPEDAQWKLTIQAEARQHPSYIGSPDFLVESICTYTQSLRLTLVEAFAREDPSLANRIRARDRQCTLAGYNE